MDLYDLNRRRLADNEQLGIPLGCCFDFSDCAYLSESNEPKTSAAKPTGRVRWDCMSGDRDNTALATIESADRVTLQAFVNQHPYLDIIDAAFLLRRPPCQIRSLAESGWIPAYALKHLGEICWKFRLRELLDWATEIGLEISPKGLTDLLSLGDKPQ
jgi:hypothetical protein